MMELRGEEGNSRKENEGVEGVGAERAGKQ